MQNVKFSVLMSVYIKERPEYLEKALESIIVQTRQPDEIVLVEDGPLTKELYEIIEKKEKNLNLKRVKLNENQGLGNALAIGLKKCSYEIVARMDTDDICKKNRFEKQLKYIVEKKYDVVGSWVDEFVEENGEMNVISIRKVPKESEKIKKQLKKFCAMNHPTVMFNKTKVLEVGNYSEKYNKLEDYYLWVKLAESNCKFYNLQESLLYFRVNLESSARRGGYERIKNDIKFQNELENIGFINRVEKYRNIIKWIAYRILPNKIRLMVQKSFLRERAK